jgi:glucose-6-phosphate isomerase
LKFFFLFSIILEYVLVIIRNFLEKKMLNAFFEKSSHFLFKKEQFSELLKKLEAEKNSETIGFYHLPQTMKKTVDEIKSYIQSLPKEIDTFLQIGVGGSALGPQTICNALHKKSSEKKFLLLDNSDPDLVAEILETIQPEKTLVNVVSKSGGTLEPAVNFALVYNFMKEKLGEAVNKHLVFTTDPENGYLKEISIRENIPTFSIPQNVGGRFSVLTPVGLLVSEFLGLNTSEMLQGANDITEIAFKDNLDENVVLKYSLTAFSAYEEGKNISVLMPYSSRLEKFAAWYKQLWAESLGKKQNEKFVGQAPISSVGAIDQHSILQLLMEGEDKFITTFIKVLKRSTVKIQPGIGGLVKKEFYGHDLGFVNNAQCDSTAEALAEVGRPSITLEIDKLDEYHLGMLFHFFELATAAWGQILGINAYNQPGVELGKQIISKKFSK